MMPRANGHIFTQSWMVLRFHHATQTYELFISGIFHFLFSDCGNGRLRATETSESETSDKGRLLC